LIVGAGILILDRDGFSLLKKRQENINVRAIICQMTDIEACGACLRGIVP
jgi:hypothetical protein